MRPNAPYRARLDFAVWLLAAIAYPMVQQSALGQTLYWDVDGATPGGSSLTTASGNWSSSDANWSNSPNGDVATQAWNNAAGDTAVFSAGNDVTALSTITVVGTRTISGIIVEEGPNYLVTGDNISLNASSAINVATELSISSALVGSGFTKTGVGELQLDGANTYIGNTAINGGTLRIVTTNEHIPDASAVTVAGGATFDLNGFVETIGSVAGAGNLIVDLGSHLITGGDNTSTTLSGVISGSGAVTKTGSGTFTLSGANSYSGTTTISSGTLSGNSIANQGTSSSFGTGNFTLAGVGKLQYTGGSASTDRSVTLSGGGQIDITNAATNLTITGSISGGALVKQGSGTLNLEGSNSYNGSIYIADGTLSGNTIANSNVNSSFGRGLSFNIISGATLQYTGTTASTNRLISLGFDGGTISVTNPGTTLTMTGVLSDIGGLTKTGAGILRLDGDNTYAGNTTISQGTLRVGADDRIPDGSAVTVASGATLDLSNASETIGSLAGAGNVVGSAGLFTGSDNSSTTFSGTISGAIYLSKFGSGTLTLSGTNSNTGEIVIAGGTLSGNTIANIGTNSSFGTGTLDSRFIFYGGTTLEYTGPSASTNRAMWLDQGGGIVSVTDESATVDWNGAINGVGGLTKDGGGTLQLDADNTYGGSTTITQGILRLGDDERIPDGSALTIASGATFDLGDNNEEGVGSLSGDGNLQLGDGLLYVGYDNSSTTFSGTISGAPTDCWLVKTGSGTFTLSGINSNRGSVGVEGGVLSGNTIGNIGVPSAFGTGVWPFFIDYGGTLEYTGPNASTNRLMALAGDGGSISVSNSATSLIWDGEISNEGDLIKSGAGTLQLNAVNTYEGTTTIAQGTLRIGASERIPDGSAVTINNSGVLDLNDFNETVGSVAGSNNIALGSGTLTLGSKDGTFSGVISGSGGLIKAGSGTQTLSGANTYTGGTTINGGKLIVSGSILGSVTVNSGGALGGSTTVSGNVTGGGRVAPGNSPGILIIDGDYTQAPSSVLEIEVGGRDSDGTPGVDFDQLQVTGTATINGLLEVPIINGFVPAVNDEVTFLTAGSVTGTFNSLVSPNLASVNPHVAMEIIKSPPVNPTEVRLRFVAPSIDIQFDNADAEPAIWSEALNWTTDTVPGTVNIINLQNVSGTSQQVNVANTDAQVHQLNVTGNDGMMIVGVKNGNILSATVGTTVGDQAVIELDNGNLASPTVAIEDGGLLAGNGTVVGNLSVGTTGGINTATLRPGFSVGQLDVIGDYEQGARGTMLIDVEGAAANEFDTVAVTGEVDLGGTVVIDAANLGALMPGETVTFLTAGALEGEFDEMLTVGRDDIYFAPQYQLGEEGSAVVAVSCGSRGNMNCDSSGVLDGADVAAFALGLRDPILFRQTYGLSPASAGSLDGYAINGFDEATFHPDGDLDFDDINDFAALMEGGSGMSMAGILASLERHLSVPEPNCAAIAYIGVGVASAGLARRRVAPQPTIHIAPSRG